LIDLHADDVHEAT